MISIIMPLYNAERFLEETLHSVQRQTYQEYELICIDDASTDRTGEILRNIQKQDNRIKIYNNEQRSGAAVSRNKGMKVAKGKYITFLDGDDIFEEEMLALAYQAAEEKQLDILMYEYKLVNSDDIYIKRCVQRSEEYLRNYCYKTFSVTEQRPQEFLNWSPSPWNKLYRKQFIEENTLEFQSLANSNDVYFVTMALMLAKRIMVLKDRRVMVYAREHDTPSRISYDRDPMCGYWAMEKILVELDKRSLLPELYQQYYLRFFFGIKAGILLAKSEEKRKYCYNFLQKEGIENIKKLGKDYYNRLDEKTRELIEGFEKKEYSSKWYEEENVLSYVLKADSERVIQLLKSNKDIIIWGAGKRGRQLLRFMSEKGLVVNAVVDIDQRKQGTVIEDCIIKAPEDIRYEKHGLIVVSASEEAYVAVKKQFSTKYTKVVYIGDYL